MNIFGKKIYKLSVVSFSVFLIVYLFVFNPPKDQVDVVYENHHFDHGPFKNIKMVDRVRELKVDYAHHMYDPIPGTPNVDLSVIGVPPSTSVIDINNDGYMDIYVTTRLGVPNRLYINHEGKYFTEEAERFGLANVNYKDNPAYALWGDFNNDGKLDLLLARWGCHSVYLRNNNDRFEEHPEWLNGYCSRPHGVNTADFYHHGRLDLVFANYLPNDDSFTVLWMANVRHDNKTGGENHLLRNDGHGFHLEKKANFLTRSYTHNAGIADINMDGLYDIFFSNDYSYDEMFLNLGNGKFRDVTNHYIPKELHGFAGMNTEFFDYNNDGMIDLYVSNIYKPPFLKSFNLLWKKKKDNTYENVSNDVGVAKCGFSWGAKFADIDNDGEPDLLVMNGRSRSSEITQVGQGKSMWYERIEVTQIPKFIRQYYRPKESLKGRYISAFERKCLFMQRKGKFYDISPEAGFDDREETRGLALIDYDNDGRMDAITSGPMARLKIYHNETQILPGNNWVGLSLKDKWGSPIPHGAKVFFHLKDKTIVRELFPANGYKGQSDPRIHLGLGTEKEVLYVDVVWPLTRAKKRYRNIHINQYNLVSENDAGENLQ